MNHKKLIAVYYWCSFTLTLTKAHQLPLQLISLLSKVFKMSLNVQRVPVWKSGKTSHINCAIKLLLCGEMLPQTLVKILSVLFFVWEMSERLNTKLCNTQSVGTFPQNEEPTILAQINWKENLKKKKLKFFSEFAFDFYFNKNFYVIQQMKMNGQICWCPLEKIYNLLDYSGTSNCPL